MPERTATFLSKPESEGIFVCTQARSVRETDEGPRLADGTRTLGENAKGKKPVMPSSSVPRKLGGKVNLKRKRADSQSVLPASQQKKSAQEGDEDETAVCENAKFEDDSDGAVRLARMRGLLEDTSGEESDSADEPLTDVEYDVEPDLSAWGIGAFAANPEEEIAECAPSSRLAVVDLDWDNIQAVDILHVMRSFLPAAGHIEKVSVYISDYGLERMAKEDAQGPGALGVFDKAKKNKTTKQSKIANSAGVHGDTGSDDSMDEDLTSGDGSESSDDVNIESLRIYEKSRLRYHYAVVECDSSETTAHLVYELDGKEFEMSHCLFDLRYAFALFGHRLW